VTILLQSSSILRIRSVTLASSASVASPAVTFPCKKIYVLCGYKLAFGNHGVEVQNLKLTVKFSIFTAGSREFLFFELWGHRKTKAGDFETRLKFRIHERISEGYCTMYTVHYLARI